jgi:hypothetical protein
LRGFRKVGIRPHTAVGPKHEQVSKARSKPRRRSPGTRKSCRLGQPSPEKIAEGKPRAACTIALVAQLMLPFQLNTSKILHPVVLGIVEPIFPGGVVALGWLCAHSDVWGHLRDERTLKVISLAFAIYVIGIVITFLNNFVLSFLAIVCLIPWRSDRSRNRDWRSLAIRFLGPEVSPPLEDTAEADRRWSDWYQILNTYFANPVKFPQEFASFYFRMLASIGWAGLIAAWICRQEASWLIWGACFSVILTAYPVGVLNFLKDRIESTNELTAQLLRAVKGQSKQ